MTILLIEVVGRIMSKEVIRMKIYQFSGTTPRNIPQFDQPDGNRRSRTFLRKASGGEDIVEISSEARRLYQLKSSVELDRARILKIARDYEPVIRELLQREKEQQGTPERALKLAELRDAVHNGRYDFNRSDALSDAAEVLLSQFSG